MLVVTFAALMGLTTLVSSMEICSRIPGEKHWHCTQFPDKDINIYPTPNSNDKSSSASNGYGGNGKSYGYENGVSTSISPDFLAPGSFGPNGPALAGTLAGTASAFAQAFNGFAVAQQEREMRYRSWRAHPVTSPEQKARAYQNFRTQLYQEQTRANLEQVHELQRSPEYKKLAEQREEFNRVVAAIGSQAQSSIPPPPPSTGEDTNFNRGEEADRVHQLLERASELNAAGLEDAKVEFLVNAATMAEITLAEREFVHSPVTERWLDRGERAHGYWTKPEIRESSSRLRLSARAQKIFNLPKVASDSFESYELIRTANTLSREPNITGDDFARMQVGLALNQAQRFAEEGEIFECFVMLENANSIRDFVRGVTIGVGQNLFDTVSGFWHVVRHPLDSAEALATAIINYEETYDLIVSKAKDVIDNYPSYSPEEKGRLFGYLATEILATVGTSGASWTTEVAKAAKLAKGLEIVFEEAAHVLKTPGLNKFETAVAALSDTGKKNVEFLRDYAKREGYALKDNPLGGPEVWGVHVGDKFEWRVKIKPEAGTREGLDMGSRISRAAVRSDSAGRYVNPFTGETGGRSVSAHLPLEQDWLAGRID